MNDGTRRWVENEDWVEFIKQHQLTPFGGGHYRAQVNFGGPMSRTPYYVYARVRRGSESIIERVEFEGEQFEPDDSAVTVPRTPDGAVFRHLNAETLTLKGFTWVKLGLVRSCRAYRTMTITSPNGIDGLDRICVLQIPERLTSGDVDHGISRREAGQPEPLSGVPLGGVGAGKIELCRDGIFRNITINGNIDAPIRRTDATFFAVRAETEGRATSRVLCVEPLAGLEPVERIEFEGAYPTATLKVHDGDLPLRVEVRASGTVIPRNVKDSALPIAIFTVTLTNTSKEPVRAAVAFCMENLLGCGGGLSPGLTDRKTLAEGFYELWEERSGNIEQPWNGEGFSGILFDGAGKREKRSEGQYVLATDSRVSSLLTGWRVDGSAAQWRSFEREGRLSADAFGASTGERTAGAIAVDAGLGPGKSRDVHFVLAWHVPVFRQSPVMDYGHYYSNHFSSAEEVAVYGLANFDRLWNGAAEVPDLLLESTLPGWFTRSLANDAFVFSSASWLTRDGRFAVNEGPTSMFGCMGTLDQKLYANHYYSLFFPELDRTELLGFARAQAENGGLQHDLGTGHLETKGGFCDWPDLVCAHVILSLKHYQLTGDQDYIDEVYPRLVRMMLEYYPRMDHDGDGLPDGPEVGNTFDSEHFEGVSCYTATLTLAALRALEDLALRRGDKRTAERCAEVFARARESAIKLLWTGRWFASYHDTATGKVNGNCHISQLAGEFYSRLCGLGPLYGDDYSREAMRWVQELNFHQGFAFPTDEATPEGKMPSRQMWGWLPHVRVCLGGLPAFLGMPEKGLEALERMDRVIGKVNDENRWDLRLFYEPDTGRQHWGRFYMSAPATWYAYQALLGYVWDKPARLLSLMPHLPDGLLPLRAPVFTPGFWAWLEVPRDRSEIRLRVIKRFDSGLRIERLRVPARGGTLSVFADGTRVTIRERRAFPEHAGEEMACEIDLDPVDELRIVW